MGLRAVEGHDIYREIAQAALERVQALTQTCEAQRTTIGRLLRAIDGLEARAA
jgi:hypothetical protein